MGLSFPYVPYLGLDMIFFMLKKSRMSLSDIPTGQLGIGLGIFTLKTLKMNDFMSNVYVQHILLSDISVIGVMVKPCFADKSRNPKLSVQHFCLTFGTICNFTLADWN